jgi:hypothetical protein
MNKARIGRSTIGSSRGQRFSTSENTKPRILKDIRLWSYEKQSHGPRHSQEGLRPEGSTSVNRSSRVQEDRNS